MSPPGEGHLRINGREIAHINEEKDRRQAFRRLKTIADRYLEEHPPKSKGKSSMIPVVKAKLLEGKRGLIVGIANENSIAWGCAKAFRAFGRLADLTRNAGSKAMSTDTNDLFPSAKDCMRKIAEAESAKASEYMRRQAAAEAEKRADGAIHGAFRSLRRGKAQARGGHHTTRGE
jgi:hypothetical protein